MSLPSRMDLVKNGTVIKSMFCNVGWWVDAPAIIRAIESAITGFAYLRDDDKYSTEKLKEIRTLDFDHFLLYSVRVKKSDFYDYILKKITKEELVSRIEQENE